MHDAFYLKQGGKDLYRAVTAMTRGLGLHGLTLRPAPFSPLFLQARGCEDLFLPGLPLNPIKEVAFSRSTTLDFDLSSVFLSFKLIGTYICIFNISYNSLLNSLSFDQESGFMPLENDMSQVS